MAELIVVTGPPGAGKSTVAQRLVDRFDASALIDGDAFFAMIRKGYIDPWTGPADRQNRIVISAAAAAAGHTAHGGYTVIYDGVVGPWSLDAFIAQSGLAFVHYAMLLPPEQICLRRVRSRAGHGFTDLTAARHMYREFERTVDQRAMPIRSTEPAESIAGTILDLVRGNALLRAAATARATDTPAR